VKKGLKIGIGIAAACGLLVFIFMYTRGNTALNKEKELRVIFPSVDGLIEASPLLLNGFRVGEVKKIDLRSLDSGKFELMVYFKLSTDLKIPEKSHARIISSDLLGTKAVELIFSNGQNLMADNEVLVGITEETFKEKIDKELAPLKGKVSNVASSFDSVSAIFKEIKGTNVKQALSASFRSINKSITALKLTTSKVDTLMDPDKSAVKGIMLHVNSIKDNLTKNKPAIDKMTSNFDNLIDQPTKDRVKNAIASVNSSIAEAKSAVAYIQSGKGTAGKFMNTKAIQDNLDKANKNMDVLLKEMLRNPDRFFKVSVFAPKKAPVPSDSL
jgi:phospholipid/cholesterol/gamma-HCH transport system substrate-binding protein